MKTYKIIRRTNVWIAQRNACKTETELENGLTLKDACRKLLNMYNDAFEDERPYASTWSVAVRQSRIYVDGAEKTRPDGTRTFSYDSRIYSIEED